MMRLICSIFRLSLKFDTLHIILKRKATPGYEREGEGTWECKAHLQRDFCTSSPATLYITP